MNEQSCKFSPPQRSDARSRRRDQGGARAAAERRRHYEIDDDTSAHVLTLDAYGGERTGYTCVVIGPRNYSYSLPPRITRNRPNQACRAKPRHARPFRTRDAQRPLGLRLGPIGVTDRLD